MNLADTLRSWALYRPERIALVDGDSGQRYTYAQLDARASAAACALRGRGVGRGDRVAVLAWNRVEQVDLYFACARLGAILVPLNWRLAAPELDAVLRDCTPAVVFVGSEVADLAGACAEIKSSRVVLFGEDPDSLWSCTTMGESEPRADLGPDAPVLLLYTSGSTGRAKGAVLTHGTITWNAVNTVVGWELRPDDVALVHTPLFHTGGWGVFLLPLLHQGACCVLTRRFDPGQCLQLVAQWRISVLFAVPTMWAMLADHKDWPSADLSPIRFAITGGAACPLPLLHRWAERGVRFKQGFGLTEVGPNCFVLPDGHELEHAGAVGFPMPHLDARRVKDDGTDAAPHEDGELWLRGPTVCLGYWNDPVATAASRRDGGWFATGDLFTQDPSGHYRFSGRKKEIYVSGGENVHPSEVERALYDLPGIAEAAVVPVADAKWGEVGFAFVAPHPGAQWSEAQILTALRDRLARYKIPKAVRVLASLPKGPSGKIDKRALRDAASAP